MPALASGFTQSVKQRALYPHRVMRIGAGLLYNGVYALEAKAGNLAQPIGTFPYQFHTARAKILVDLHGCIGCNLERGENGHQFAHSFAFRISRFNILKFFIGNTPNFQQLFRHMFQNVQCVYTKTLNHGFCRSCPNTFEQSGSQIRPDTLDSRRYNFAPLPNL